MCPSTRSGEAPQRRCCSQAVALLAFTMVVAVAGAAASEPCKLGRAGELPVTMRGLRPLVHVAINGTDAVLIAESGTFFSMLTPAGARQLNLRLEPAPNGLYVTGIGGDARTWVTTVRTLRLFDLDIPNVPFIVAGSDLGDGVVGALGQNVFRLGDVEFDLANGTINIVRTSGSCRKTSLAYWADAKGLPYSVMDVDPVTTERPKTTGTAYVNGSKIRVEFDSGAGASVISLAAAKQAGVTPESPGVRPAGTLSGIGRRSVRTWIASFTSFKIGDEEIRNTHLRIGDLELRNVDLLLATDFFLSHHILVASSQNKVYFTYNGGPVFNLTNLQGAASAATQAGAAAGTAHDAKTDESGSSPPANIPAQPAPSAPLDAAEYARRGSASAARHDYEHALADLTRAIELDPSQADYFFQRALAYSSANQNDKALADFDSAIMLKPDDVDALMGRASLRVRRRDPSEVTRPDLDAIDRAAPKAADVRLKLGDMYGSVLHDHQAAIAQYDHWIDAHNSDDLRMPRAFNQRCWARALLGQELDQALRDCNAAVGANPKVASFHDSRGLVYLRQGKYAKAVADYDAALAANPKSAWSLYGRGLAKQHLGQSAAGEADIAAAKALFPKIAEEAASHGIGQDSK